jgi:hypothetical protein
MLALGLEGTLRGLEGTLLRLLSSTKRRLPPETHPTRSSFYSSDLDPVEDLFKVKGFLPRDCSLVAASHTNVRT